MPFFLYILFILPLYLFSAENEGIIQKHILPFFTENGKIEKESTESLTKKGIVIPELCYGVSEDPKENPLLIVGVSPCIAAFIKGKDKPKTIGFHVSAHNDINSMINIINIIFDVKKDTKPELYVTLFTLTNHLYNDARHARNIFKNEQYHEGRLTAIIEKLKANYTLIHPQYHMPYLLDKNGKEVQLYNTYNQQDVQHNDRHVICNGFDEASQCLQVYRLDLKQYPIFGKNFAKNMRDFSSRVIKKVCHENQCEVTIVEQEESQPEEEMTSLRLGEKWDYPFFKIDGPNVEAIVKYRQGQELIDDTLNPISAIATPPISSTASNAAGDETKPIATPSNPNAPQGKNPSFITRWYNAAKQSITNSLTWFNVATAVGLAGLAGWLYTRWGNNSTPSTPHVERSALTGKLLPNKP